MQSDLAAEDSKYQSSRMKIVQNSSRSMLEAARSSANKIKQINEQASSNRNSIISNFTRSSQEDQRKFEAERATIIRDGGIEIHRIEQERLEKLRELELGHNDRVDELTANRDALGLVLEQRKHDRDREEVNRQTNIEIAKRRADLAIRLQDLQANFAAERAQKQAQFMLDLQENEAKRQADLKAEREHYSAQVQEIAQNRAAQLRELAMQHNEERKRIRENFIAKVRDLDASLLNEQQKKRQAYSLMMNDLDRFLADYRNNLGSGLRTGGGAVPQFAAGGYTPDGLIRSHRKEFIANQSTTRMLERLIGGRLSQQNVIAAVANQGGGTNVTWNDQRRFSGEYTKGMRRQVQNDTIATIGEVFKK
jgi:hypothetical protein